MPILTGDLDVEKVRRIVSEFPEAAGFGIGTKLSGEVQSIAGVIFKQCLIEGQPTLKASNNPEKTTLPGRLQIFRGTDAGGDYVGDIIGLDDETPSIPGAVRIERLLMPFWENGQHAPIPSIEKQKAFVEEQLARFREIDNYPCALSERLRRLRDELTAQMRVDQSGWEGLLKIHDEVTSELIATK
jgi:nicotinate phosphoribosyltransferase